MNFSKKHLFAMPLKTFESLEKILESEELGFVFRSCEANIGFQMPRACLSVIAKAYVSGCSSWKWIKPLDPLPC